MPNDKRYYITFTVEFPHHPKIAILSDEAFRCLHEAIAHSRELQTDGFLARRYALGRWGAEVLMELCNNDDENPSLIETDKGWVIHDYGEHQDTKEMIEQRTVKRKEAGQKGGIAKAAKRAASNGLAKASKGVAQARDPASKPLATPCENLASVAVTTTATTSGQESAHRYVGDTRRAQTAPADDDAFEQATSERGSDLSPPVGIGASRLVGLAFPIGTITDAVRTTLRIKTNEGLTKHHRTENDMAECLRIWSTKDDLGPNALLCCLAEVDKRKLNGRKLSTSDRNWYETQAKKGDPSLIKSPMEVLSGFRAFQNLDLGVGRQKELPGGSK